MEEMSHISLSTIAKCYVCVALMVIEWMYLLFQVPAWTVLVVLEYSAPKSAPVCSCICVFDMVMFPFLSHSREQTVITGLTSGHICVFVSVFKPLIVCGLSVCS